MDSVAVIVLCGFSSGLCGCLIGTGLVKFITVKEDRYSIEIGMAAIAFALQAVAYAILVKN